MSRPTAPPDLPPVPRLLTALGAVSTPIQRRRIKAKLHRDRAILANAAAWLAEHFDQPAPSDVDPDWFVQAANEAQEKERAAAELFHPVVEALKGLLEPKGTLEPESEQLVRDGVEVLEGWLAFYRGRHEMLVRQLAERGASGGEVLQAHPVTGDIDHSALSREFIARFPKIRAALAK